MFWKFRKKPSTYQPVVLAPPVQTVVIVNHNNHDGKVESRFFFQKELDEKRFVQLVEPQFGRKATEMIRISVSKTQLSNNCFSIHWSMPDGRYEPPLFKQLEAYLFDLLEHSLELENVSVKRAHAPTDVVWLCHQYGVKLKV